jgi:MFS superfamily sulfate permease-like transporter
MKTNVDADPIALATLLALMVGVFTLLLGLFRLGFLDSILSRALIRGLITVSKIRFVSAVAVVVIIEMMPTLLRIPVDQDTEKR